MTISKNEWNILRYILLGMAESEQANRESGSSPGPLPPETLRSFIGDVDNLVK